MDTPAPSQADAAVLRRERDLYLRLLDLGHEVTLAPFLKEALGLLVEITAAQEGYLELYDDDDLPENPRWWIAHGLSTERIDHVRATISRGIIAESVASGRTIVTPAAILDPRFSHRASVRRGRLQAVLCAPIGADRPRGVLYLTGSGTGAPFSEDDRARVELVTRHLGPVTDRLLLQARLETADDETRPLRTTLRLEGLVGRSKALAAVLREVAIAAPTSKTVLLTGETGTGKTQLARVIHENSPRHRGPFVEVSCTNIPEGLVERTSASWPPSSVPRNAARRGWRCRRCRATPCARSSAPTGLATCAIS
jgi:Nif-specific regulatory protein